MNKKQILVICAHPDILQTIARLINNNPEWNCVTAPGYSDAIDHISAKAIHLVLLGSGIEPADEENLTAFCRQQNPPIVVVQHYGGGSGLLYAEIHGALNRL